ncbi:CAAX geranylgeranyltransferase alpha subunit [Orbilia brochopaga]|uniref:Protein farnesyltransferase/geranylgeranyltransferase type-1 subunit alpha n=1 Tax=Orbilia brochopaga TaxID=3140254 RepID=A0AAV9U6H8_9PEZI
MSYLRAVMAANDHSPRVLALTAEIIDMNPAHYTVWGYRFRTLMSLDTAGQLGTDAVAWTWSRELDWVQSIARNHEKNYQIWHHRQLIVDHLADSTGERARTEEMFALDSKNYHVWTYRQWLVRRFALFDEEELALTTKMLGEDIRNNSAWNHRFFVVFGALPDGQKPAEEVVEREIEFAKKAIQLTPQNPSPWSYIKAVLRKGNVGLATLQSFCEQFSPVSSPDDIKSSHALDVLSEIYDEAGDAAKAEKALELLASKFDPVRKNYWRYRRRQLGSNSPVVSATA